jgi:diadenosine tetraphosphatase ApaH/serine/threonine PP2A family protein phosphatase
VRSLVTRSCPRRHLPPHVCRPQIWCVHGGLSPSAESLDDVRALPRVMVRRSATCHIVVHTHTPCAMLCCAAQDVPDDGPYVDMLCSEPEDITGWGLVPQGRGFLFGPDITAEFARVNGLSLLARGRQLVMEVSGSSRRGVGGLRLTRASERVHMRVRRGTTGCTRIGCWACGRRPTFWVDAGTWALWCTWRAWARTRL